MFDSMVMADSPEITEKLHGVPSTVNLLTSSALCKYGGRSGAPDRIISSGFSFRSCGLQFGILSRIVELEVASAFYLFMLQKKKHKFYAII
jgi:hypothetical protein